MTANPPSGFFRKQLVHNTFRYRCYCIHISENFWTLPVFRRILSCKCFLLRVNFSIFFYYTSFKDLKVAYRWLPGGLSLRHLKWWDQLQHENCVTSLPIPLSNTLPQRGWTFCSLGATFSLSWNPLGGHMLAVDWARTKSRWISRCGIYTAGHIPAV